MEKFSVISFRHIEMKVTYDTKNHKALLNAVWGMLEANGVQDIERIEDASSKYFYVEYVGGAREPIQIVRTRKAHNK